MLSETSMTDYVSWQLADGRKKKKRKKDSILHMKVCISNGP